MYCVEGATACDTTENEFCITIQVRNDSVPHFDSIAPYCMLDMLSVLPMMSSDSITGTWSGTGVLQGTTFDPSVGTQDLLFIPDLGQCADTIGVTIWVEQAITPSFDSIPMLCFNGPEQPLALMSDNGIMGYWSGEGVLDSHLIEPIAGEDSLSITFQPYLDQCGFPLDIEVPIVRLEAVIGETLCDDSNTPDDPSDDTYTVDLVVNGTNVSNGWTANDPLNSSGIYGSNSTLGPYNATDTLDLIITDNNDSNCNYQFRIQAPQDCGIVSSTDLIKNGIKVFPNPFNDQVVIQSETGIHYESELINTIGQVVKRYSNNVIRTADVLPGVYYLRIKSNGEVLGTTAVVKVE